MSLDGRADQPVVDIVRHVSDRPVQPHPGQCKRVQPAGQVQHALSPEVAQQLEQRVALDEFAKRKVLGRLVFLSYRVVFCHWARRFNRVNGRGMVAPLPAHWVADRIARLIGCIENS